MAQKKATTTRDLILDRALALFNVRGIEYVGLREIAAELEIHVGNLTYYFPTKDDLVNQLAIDLNRLNSRVFRDEPRLTLTSFVEMLREVFHNHLRYRCLMLSLVHVMTQNKVVSARHKKTQRARNAQLAANIAALAEAGHIRIVDAAEEAQLAETIALIARFWISEATISYRRGDAVAQVDHYLSLIGRLLLPYTSSAGRDELRPYVATYRIVERRRAPTTQTPAHRYSGKVKNERQVSR
jgi:AcrR family transcriptional regulator